jgi:hypothetical protein
MAGANLGHRIETDAGLMGRLSYISSDWGQERQEIKNLTLGEKDI